MACHKASIMRKQGGVDAWAGREGPGAARMEGAARWRIEGRRKFPAQHDALTLALRVGLRRRRQQGPRVGVARGIEELIAAAEAKNYNEIIVLGYRHEITEPEADAQTMLTMLQLNQMFDDNSNKVNKTRLVAEILDGGKAELARVAAVDDLVVSDNLAALLIAQISENNDLAPVFDDLFDAHGAAINLRPVEQYVAAGETVEWAEVVAIAAAHGESAIGYRAIEGAHDSASTGVVMNPAKNSQFTANAGDGIVVIANV